MSEDVFFRRDPGVSLLANTRKDFQKITPETLPSVDSSGSLCVRICIRNRGVAVPSVSPPVIHVAENQVRWTRPAAGTVCIIVIGMTTAT